MIKKRRFPKIFPGWWIVLTSGILALWGDGFSFYGFSAFFKPISLELGFSRAVTSIAPSIRRLQGGLESPLSGWITDRFGARWLVLSGVFIMGLALILMYFVNSLWAFLVVWGVMLGTGNNIALSLPLDTTIANWFVKKRGLALGTKIFINGFTGAVVPLVAWLIATQGWRMAAVIGGVVIWIIGFPLVWIFVKQHRPEYYGLLPDGAVTEDDGAEQSQMIDRGVQYAAEIEEIEFTLRQTFKTRVYWMLIFIRTISSLGMPVMSIHAIPFLTDRGIDPIKAAAMMAIYILAGVPFRFLGGVIADRIRLDRLPWVIAGTYLIQASGFAAFLLSPSETMIYVWFIFYGIGMGARMAPDSVMRARYFGRKAYGSISGVTSLLMTPIGIFAPIYVGWMYDTTGSYTTVFTLLTGILLFSAVLFPILIRRPKPPTEVGSIRNFM
ncbi:MFS transporter [Chloroflexota bacterium]